MKAEYESLFGDYMNGESLKQISIKNALSYNKLRLYAKEQVWRDMRKQTREGTKAVKQKNTASICAEVNAECAEEMRSAEVGSEAVSIEGTEESCADSVMSAEVESEAVNIEGAEVSDEAVSIEGTEESCVDSVMSAEVSDKAVNAECAEEMRSAEVNADGAEESCTDAKSKKEGEVKLNYDCPKSNAQGENGDEHEKDSSAENTEIISVEQCLNKAVEILSRATLKLCRESFEENNGFCPDISSAKGVKEYWSALKEAVPVISGLCQENDENTLRVIMDTDALKYSQ